MPSPDPAERTAFARGWLSQRQALGLLRAPASIGGTGWQVRVDGRVLTVLGSNDYLGLGRDPHVINAMQQEAAAMGTASTGSRTLTGNLEGHLALEEELAQWLGTESAILFGSGYAANLGVISALVGKEDHIVSDELNHASIIDGCRLSRARVTVTPHGDVEAVRAALDAIGRREAGQAPPLVVCDSLTSMEGLRAPLHKLSVACASAGALLLVDEAHTLGLYGPGGNGMCTHTGVRPDLISGSLAKSTGSVGGFAAGTAPLIEFIRQRARAYVYSAALPPPDIAAARAAVRRCQQGDDLRSAFWERDLQLRKALSDVLLPHSGRDHIHALYTFTPSRTLALQQALAEAGFLVPGIRPPTVKEGMLRLSTTADTPAAALEPLAAALAAGIATLPPNP